MKLFVTSVRYLAVTALLFVVIVLASFLLIKPDPEGVNAAIYAGADKDEQPVATVVLRRPGRAMKPNIIVIMADDLDYGDTSGKGALALKTPNRYQMAAEGMSLGKWHLGDFSADWRYHPMKNRFDGHSGFPASSDDFPVQSWRNEQKLVDDISSGRGERGPPLAPVQGLTHLPV